MSADPGRPNAGTCNGCGEWDDDLTQHLCEFHWRAALEEAAGLLEEYGRHDVTLVCQACGAGYSDEHRPECRIGIWLKEYSCATNP